ncbi:FKBP-type peptidyl-prolyl cis-trans isomerase SlyD [Deinococcus reticulitermitis]|uniref:Peptidyl-prolyl cis-trans isomerase n=1 Tax=Deinococcus reticulitermitis TaxID=856736 RepID=A0A1H7AAG1_9DEIO|nr:peptidylprolyl isomerase [Deinococcus reticulitermitis]SEJ59072.1 FKBP-type peptidyl-prolyl cis-trans isomerase SlyD [Deinococcus reticulitermitis]
MKIAQDKVVDIDYTLTVDGEVIDSSAGEQPLVYLHGHGLIIPGLERALEGREVGDSFQITVAPEDGYGERNEEAVETLERADFDDTVEVGETYYMQATDGTSFPFTVISMDGESVRADFNPPLAGKTLNFDVQVRAVRDATPEEIEHGHAHADDMDGD